VELTVVTKATMDLTAMQVVVTATTGEITMVDLIVVVVDLVEKMGGPVVVSVLLLLLLVLGVLTVLDQ
jgi:hypothetical protein